MVIQVIFEEWGNSGELDKKENVTGGLLSWTQKERIYK